MAIRRQEKACVPTRGWWVWGVVVAALVLSLVALVVLRATGLVKSPLEPEDAPAEPVERVERPAVRPVLESAVGRGLSTGLWWLDLDDINNYVGGEMLPENLPPPAVHNVLMRLTPEGGLSGQLVDQDGLHAQQQDHDFSDPSQIPQIDDDLVAATVDETIWPEDDPEAAADVRSVRLIPAAYAPGTAEPSTPIIITIPRSGTGDLGVTVTRANGTQEEIFYRRQS
jgi:hypothetical protein